MKLTDILKELNVPTPKDAYPLKGPVTDHDTMYKRFEYTFKTKPAYNPWNAEKSYKSGVRVNHNGSNFESKTDGNMGNEPRGKSDQNWELTPSTYDITIETNFLISDSAMYVVFYETKNKMASDEDSKYNTITNSGDMLKVLATVVRAVNRTADEQLGGMQNVRVIRISPADKSRRSVYKHYAKTLFPNFKVEDLGSWISLINKDYEPKD